jgi:hypothetical protein
MANTQAASSVMFAHSREQIVSCEIIHGVVVVFFQLNWEGASHAHKPYYWSYLHSHGLLLCGDPSPVPAQYALLCSHPTFGSNRIYFMAATCFNINGLLHID